MARRRPTDFVAWTAYRRAWAVPVIALLLLFVTSFRAEAPVQATLPPTVQNEQAGELLAGAATFSDRFPDRRPGSPGSFDSAQWMLDQFQGMDELTARTVPATTTSPTTNASVGLVNVEATLPGRTRELVVVLAHRDTADANGRGGDAVGQMSLLALAKELAATRDRRRTYLFVSTDAATMNGGGARALADRLAKRGGVVAIVALDRLDAGGDLRVDAAPSGTFATPLGLVQTARGAVGAEGGSTDPGSVLGQVSQLAVPITLREHGQLLARGLPALTITSGDDQLRDSADTSREGDAASGQAAAVGSGLRATQRFLGTLDQLDRVQTAGKTWASSERRVYRGWALKIFIASLLVPVWVVAVDLLVRQRRAWNLFALVGTSTRAMLAGVWAIGSLWLLGALGVLTRSGDQPPNPMALEDVRAAGMLIWLLLVVAGWLLARGPDWRRSLRRDLAPVAGRDNGDVAVAVLVLVVIAGLALAINPYTVLFAAPALHAWPWLVSRRAHTRAMRTGIWALGFGGPLLAIVTIGARGDLGLSAFPYAIHLVQTRTVPPMLGLLIGAAGGLTMLLFVAARGGVATPVLPQLRRIARDGGVDPVLLPRIAVRLLVRGARALRPERFDRPARTPRTARRAGIRLPRRPEAGGTRSSRPPRSGGRGETDGLTPAARRELEARERAARRAARERVNSR